MFLKNKNIIFKIRRSKFTDYAALSSRVKPGIIGHFSKSLLQILISPVVVALDDRNGQRIEVYSIHGQREANLACLSSSR